LNPEGVMNQEHTYLTALGAVDRLEADALRLFYSGGVLVFAA
jgi:hypothetical protein